MLKAAVRSRTAGVCWMKNEVKQITVSLVEGRTVYGQTATGRETFGEQQQQQQHELIFMKIS